MERFVVNDQSGTINRPVYGRYYELLETFQCLNCSISQLSSSMLRRLNLACVFLFKAQKQLINMLIYHTTMDLRTLGIKLH